RIRVFQPERRTAPTGHFGIVATAVLKRSRLWIRHYNRKDDRETEREISPQRLVHYRDNWYVDGYSHMREALRSFAVDAIRAAELLLGIRKFGADAEGLAPDSLGGRVAGELARAAGRYGGG